LTPASSEAASAVAQSSARLPFRAAFVTRFRDEFQRHIDEGGCPFVETSPFSSYYHHDHAGVPG